LKFTSNTLLCSKTLTATAQLCQKAKPVIITLTPGSYTVNRNAGSVTFAITVDGIDQSKLKVRSSGDMITSTSFNADKSILTVQYSGNPNVETRTGEVCVSDADSIVFNCATITQYGRDPELNVSNLIIDYNEQYSTSFIETKGVDNVSVAIDGDVIISDYTLTPTTGGYTLIVETPTNDSFNILRSTCTVTGTVSVGQYVGNTITKTFEIIKMAKDGVISINPTTQHIGKAGGPLTFDMFYGNINLSTVRSNYGTFSADKSKLYVNVGANNTPADRTITVIVTGNDNNSNATSATAVITQYTVDPFIEVNDIGISNTQQTVQVPINTKYIDNLTVEFEGDVVINDYTLVKTVGGYLLTIITADNLGDAPLYSTATFTGDITTEEGATLTKTVQVIKYGKEGIIYVDPAEFILKKAGGEVKVYLSYNNMDVASVTSNLGTFSDNKGVLIYDVAPNPDTVDRTITITISGTDVSGITKTAEVKIIQYGLDPYITITPASQTVRYNNDTAVFTVTSYKVTDLFVSFVGNIDITSYSLDNGLLTIVSADNNEELSIIEEITVTGTSDYLETVSATATLTKMGTGGGIVIDPEYKIAGNAGLLAIPYYADRVDEDTVYAFINGDIDVSNISVNRAGKFILIEYGANGSSSRASTLIVTCNDEDGIPRTTTSTITQLPNTYSFSINPTRRTIGYQASTVTNSVVKSNITSISSFTYYGDMDATYTYDNDSTITIAAQTNSDSSRKYGVVSLTGVAGSGDTVTASGYILQNNEY
jgi:methyl coenzyme M reductase subunit C